MSSTRKRREAGQALVLIGLSLVVLTGVLGLSIDMGYLRYTKRRMQTAADSAAIAGASELKVGDYRAAALNDSKANGFEDGLNGVMVTPSSPPADPPFAGGAHTDYVEVQVRGNAPTYFMRIFGVNSAMVGATAVARLGNSHGCIYALGAVGGINVNADVNAATCGVVDNAVLTINRGCINAASIGVVGNALGGCANPPPRAGITPGDDPLAYVNPPGVGACDFPNTVVNNANANVTTTLNPGVYCGGIQVARTNAGPVNFQPGLYVLNGGGLQDAGAGALGGNGVTFFVNGGGSVLLQGTGDDTFTAPTAPPAPGIPGGLLFFQDRKNGNDARFSNGNVTLTGALYFPSAGLRMAGALDSPYLILVSQTLQVDGTMNIGGDYSSLAGGSPIRAAVLVQ